MLEVWLSLYKRKEVSLYGRYPFLFITKQTTVIQSNATHVHFDSNFAFIRVLFNSSIFGSLISISKLFVKIYFGITF